MYAARTVTIAVSAMVVSVTLSACASSNEPPTLTASAVASSGPLTAGETVRPRAEGQIPAGGRAYALADGSKVVVVADEPLPDVVVEDLRAEVTAVFHDRDDEGNRTRAQSLHQGLLALTGKDVVVIAGTYSSLTDVGPSGLHWTAHGPHTFVGMSSKSDQVEAVHAWIAEQPDPATFDVIVVRT